MIRRPSQNCTFIDVVNIRFPPPPRLTSKESMIKYVIGILRPLGGKRTRMKKLIVSLTVFLFFTGVGISFAYYETPEKYPLEIGPLVSYSTYEQPGVMKEEGYLYGIGASFTSKKTFMARLEGRFLFGLVDYTGSGTMDDIEDYIFEFRGLLGYDLISKATVLTPYIGIGYRYLNDDFAGTTSTAAKGYGRNSKYYYSPIGIEANLRLGPLWSIRAIFEYDYFLSGVQESNLSDKGPAFNDVSNDQDGGYGYRGSIKVRRKTHTFNYILEPYYIYWEIDESNMVDGFVEPENNTVEYGVKAAIEF